MATSDAVIRAARPDDVTAMHALVVELAEYEREPDAVVGTPGDLARALFEGTPAGHVALHGLVAEADGQVVGLAVWFLNYSTWRGRHGIYLEDLYVTPEYRGRGLGRSLLAALAGVCIEHGYARLEWSVLDWNIDAINFYRALGAVPMAEWTVFRLTDEALAALAE